MIRVGDGDNFKNSTRHCTWGFKKSGGQLGKVKKIKAGDLLCFSTSNKHAGGGYIIGIGVFVESYDRDDEPLIKINTKTNDELGWSGTENWAIQIKYKNLVNTSGREFMKTIYRSSGSICNYDKLIAAEKHTLPDEEIRVLYKNFLKYGMKY